MLSTAAGRRALGVGLVRRQQPLGHAGGAGPLSRMLFLASPSVSRSYVSAPRPGDGPLMERRADRELPDVVKARFRWSRTLPWFFLIVAGCSVAIFNYQKASSPVVASTLYALRTSPRAREYLGDEIYFQQRIPWISGEMNQLHGRIDIVFGVKGTRNTARMRFASRRLTPRGVFETLEWSLEVVGEDGRTRKIDLLQDVPADPFRGIQVLTEDEEDALEDLGLAPPPGGVRGEHGSAVVAANALVDVDPKESAKETRGFRQANKR
ncbi:cytochrome c oxidase assembly protein [Niveomyces insectorum RCEF 264]|uniref:Cytochrome c oxidase assembly protein n=1 Tax=Niveomyces insectorum RCEF 264 TaxID=1081102 RepID=A0A167TWI1_9HYPO|nr:cytochrome c oxidase assembly protein [Niveomyces insectorum RCEF 264]